MFSLNSDFTINKKMISVLNEVNNCPDNFQNSWNTLVFQYLSSLSGWGGIITEIKPFHEEGNKLNV